MARSMPLFDIAALRRLEAMAAVALGDDARALMERAGEAAWRTVLQHWPHARRILILCGPGNNGGDGLVLARHARAAGRDVCVLQVPGRPPGAPLARAAMAAFVAEGGSVADAAGALPDADLIVDALLGIGLSRAPDAALAGLIGQVNVHRAPVLSLDVPSGIDADRGSAPGIAVRADRTLQFLARHRGLRTGTAIDWAGELSFAPLGVPEAVFGGVEPAAHAWRAGGLPALLPARLRDAHKGQHGHVLCIGGDAGSGGAIVLAAEAALRCGAGLVSVATRGAHTGPLLSRCPEAMPHGVDDPAAIGPLLDRATVVALGPGLGQGDWGRALLDAALQGDAPCVVDADALNLLAASGGRLRAGDIATPHPGEAARLLGTSTAVVQADRFDAAARLGQRLGCTVVLKGAGSIVQAVDAPPDLIGAGNPGMATGGMGDLLTGTIAGLLAQAMPPREAALAGALLHACAGDAAARDGGERGLLPTDLLPWLRRLANPLRR